MSSGLSFSTEEPLGSETVYLDAKNRPLSEVLAKFASATGGKWMKKGEAYVLSRVGTSDGPSPELLARIEVLNGLRDELLRFAATPMTAETITPIVKKRNEYQIQLEKNFTQETSSKKYSTEHLDPAFRFLGRCLQSVNIGELAAMQPQATLVWTLEPNASQKQLQPSALEAGKLLVQEQKVWGPILKSHYKPDQGTFSTDTSINFTKGYGRPHTTIMGWSRTVPYDKAPSSIKMSILCYQQDVYNVDITLYDAQQKEIETLSFSDLNTWPKRNEKPKESSKHAFDTSAKINPSPETTALWRRFGNGLDRPELGPINVYERFLIDPVNNDPLWFGNHELLEGLAKAQSKSIVACLPDDAHFHFDEFLSFKDYFDLPNGKGILVEEDPNWISLLPKDVAHHRLARTDRHILAAFSDSFRRNGNFDIVPYARLEANESKFKTYYAYLVNPKYYVGSAVIQVPFQSAFSKLLVSLAPDQVKRLKEGQIIPYRDVTPEQQKLCSQIVYGARVNTDTEGRADSASLNGSLFNGEGLGYEFQTKEIICCHNQVPSIGTNDDTFYTIDPSDKGPGFHTGPGPRVPKGGMKDATYDIRRIECIKLRCYLKGKDAVVGIFEQQVPKATTKPVPLEQLPKDVQQKIAPTIEFLSRFNR